MEWTFTLPLPNVHSRAPSGEKSGVWGMNRGGTSASCSPEARSTTTTSDIPSLSRRSASLPVGA